MIDHALFVTNVAAALCCWGFLGYYLTRFGWEKHTVGRYIVAGVSALTGLVSSGLLRRLDSVMNNSSHTSDINALAAVAYAITAVVLGAALLMLISSGRRSK